MAYQPVIGDISIWVKYDVRQANVFNFTTLVKNKKKNI